MTEFVVALGKEIKDCLTRQGMQNLYFRYKNIRGIPQKITDRKGKKE